MSIQLAITSQFSQQRGFGILGSLVALSVAIGLMSLGSRYLQHHLDANVNRVTAHHLKVVSNAATQYVQDHYQDCSNTPPALTIKDLTAAGYLPAETPEKNNRRQQYSIKVSPEKTGNLARLQVLITTHQGEQIAEKSLRQITNLVGANAGYISLLSPEKITGNQESWGLEGHGGMSVGHLATLDFVNQTEVLDAGTFLRRTKVAGHPEYNKMETDLQLADNKKIFFRDDAMGIQLSQYQLSSKRGNTHITLSNQQSPEIVVAEGDSRTRLAANQITLGSNNENSDTKSAMLGQDKLTLEVKKADKTVNYAQLTAKNLWFDSGKYKVHVTDKDVIAEVKDYDFSNQFWKLDKDVSKIRSQLDYSGVRLPYYFFEESTNSSTLHRYATYICGSTTNTHTNEDGKLFVLDYLHNTRPGLYVCANGYPRKLLFEDSQ